MKIAFYKGTKRENQSARLFDRLICAVTNSKYSHVELIESMDASGAVCWSSSVLDGGIRMKTINIHSGKWDVVDTDFDLEKAVKWFKDNEGRKYDYLGLVWFIIPVSLNIRSRYFCSEAVANSIQLQNPYKISPQGLYEVLTK